MSTKTKKKDFKNRVDIDKLSEKLASKNLNFDINDFKKTLDKYSIPSLDNENNDVYEFLRDLKTKTQKRKKKAEIYFDDNVQEFTSSITSESKILKPKPIRLSTPSPSPCFIQTKDKEMIVDDLDIEEPRTRFKTKTQKRVKFNMESPKLKRKHEELINPRYNLDSLLETAKTITRNDNTKNNIIKPVAEKPEDKVRVIRVDAKLFGLNDDEEEQKKLEKERLEREKKEREKERELEKERERERLEKEKQERELEKEREKERLRELRELKELLREKEKEREREKEKERARERELEKERIRLEKEKLRERLRPKTKEELYQESLARQIGLVEDKINQLEYLSQYLPPNHSSIIQLQVDIITEKKKLKELLPNNKKEKKGKLSDLSKQDVDSFRDFYSNKDKDGEHKNDEEENDCGKEISESKNKMKPTKKEEDKGAIRVVNKEDINIFKYDRKTVEKEYQERYQHLHNNNLQNNQRNIRNNPPMKEPVKAQNYNMSSIKKAPTLTSLSTIPFIPRTDNTYCQYPIEEDDFPMPEKKVSVKESSNMTCEIPVMMNSKFVELDEEIDGFSNQNRFSNKPNIENKKQIIKGMNTNESSEVKIIKPDETFHQKKTMINTKRYKKSNESEQNARPDNELNNSVNENMNEKQPRRKIKLTQKREKDYLVNKKIINENKNLPENLMNFLYSSMVDNDYQINFIDILNQ